MSYPPVRYTGEKGEVSARLRPAAAGPDHTTPTDTPETATSYHYLGTGANTAGEIGLYRVEMGPLAKGPRNHFHRTIAESFYIIGGSLSLFDGERWVEGGPGDFLYVPVGGLHAFDNTSGAPVSMLMLFTPGAPRERYFEGLAELGGLDDEQRARFFLDHDSYFL